MIYQPVNVHLTGLKRQLETDFVIKLPRDDFFKKVKTVEDLVKAVQKAVKERPEDSTTKPPAPRGLPDEGNSTGSCTDQGDPA